MFSADNIQPPESFANACGLFIEDYIQAVRELADVWAVPVIDLASISGLYPMLDEHAKYFRNADTDRLHRRTLAHGLGDRLPAAGLSGRLPATLKPNNYHPI